MVQIPCGGQGRRFLSPTKYIAGRSIRYFVGCGMPKKVKILACNIRLRIQGNEEITTAVDNSNLAPEQNNCKAFLSYGASLVWLYIV